MSKRGRACTVLTKMNFAYHYNSITLLEICFKIIKEERRGMRKATGQVVVPTRQTDLGKGGITQAGERLLC